MDPVLNQNNFEFPDDLYQFVDKVIQKLRQAGQEDAAKVLADWHSTAYTTGSEWLGDLGLAIRKIQKQGKIDKSIKADLERLLREIHKTWRFI